MRSLSASTVAAFSMALLAGGIVEAQSFSAGNVVVSLVGDGTTSITTGTVAVPITLTEYTTSGSLTGASVMLPTVDAGANYAITGGMTSTSFGFLKRSVDGNYLTITGAATPAGTGGSVFGNGLFPNRTIARVDAARTVDSSTRFNAAGTTPRSVVTTTGTDFWWSGDTGSGSTGGIRYLTLGSTSSGVALAQVPAQPPWASRPPSPSTPAS